MFGKYSKFEWDELRNATSYHVGEQNIWE